MRTLAADGVDDGAAPAAAGRSTSTPAWLVPLAIGAVVAVGVVARFVQRSPLWLDEALSVNIPPPRPVRHRDAHFLDGHAARARRLPGAHRRAGRAATGPTGGAHADLGRAAAEPLLVLLPAGCRGPDAGVPLVAVAAPARRDGAGSARRRGRGRAVPALARRGSPPRS